MDRTLFCVVDGKHKAWEGSDYKGVVSASIEGSVCDVSCGFWPILFGFVVPGLQFTGNLQSTEHPRFGRQYSARSVEMVNTRFQVLIAVMHKQLTAALMKRLQMLTRRFGEAVFEKLESVSAFKLPPESLVSGKVSIEHVKTIAETFEACKQAASFTDLFPPIDPQMALKYAPIVKVDEIRDNPYVLYWRKPDGKMHTNPLHVADTIARQHLQETMRPADLRRLAAYFEAAIKAMQRDVLNERLNGSTWFGQRDIVKYMMSLQGEVDASWRFDSGMLERMFDTKPPFMAEENGRFARASDHSVEVSLAKKLVKQQRATGVAMHGMRCLSLFDDMAQKVSEEAADAIVSDLDAICAGWRKIYRDYCSCDERQRSALRILCERKGLVLIGGAGTGKTTTLALILRFARLILGVDMKACALTGKAVDRLKQLFDEDEVECRTLHSLSAMVQQHPVRALAIDEASMASPALVEKILSSEVEYLVICGDDKQLPSIDAGAFLRDILQANIFPLLRLRRIYRTGEGSGIATEAPKIFGTGGSQLASAAVDRNGFKIVVNADLAKAVHEFGKIAKNTDEVIMISNTRRTCKEANLELQPICNPNRSGDVLARSNGYAPWIVGDRVISNENFDAESGERIFNGMFGVVQSVDLAKKKVTVRFRDIVQQYDSNDQKIDHAYCVTTWKFQGSEMQHAVVFFESSWGLSCELLYTAVTRGQVSTTVVVSVANLSRALENRLGPLRTTCLTQRLLTELKKRSRDEASD